MQLNGVDYNTFWQSANKLLIGNSAAQLTLLATTPILTRLYTPEDFSSLAVYTACVIIGLSVSCLKLDIAIPVAKTQTDAKNLFLLSCCSSAMTGLLLFGLVLIFRLQLYQFDFPQSSTNYIVLAPFGIFLGGLFSAFHYWAVRQEKFLAIGSIRFLQAIICVAIQIVMAISVISPHGLVFGHLSMPLFGLILYFLYLREGYDQKIFLRKNFLSMAKTLKRFERFPKFSVFADLATNAGLHLPIIIIAAFASPLEAGFLFLAMRVIGTPISIVSVSIGQIYLSKLNRLEVQQKTQVFTAFICKNIIHFLLLPLAFITIFASDLCAILFGEEWRKVGDLLLLMLPWYVFQSLSSPISNLLHAQKKQLLLFRLSIFGLVLRVFPLIICFIFSPTYAMTVLFVCAAIYYFISLTIFLAAAHLRYLEIIKFYVFLFVKIFAALMTAMFLKSILGF